MSLIPNTDRHPLIQQTWDVMSLLNMKELRLPINSPANMSPRLRYRELSLLQTDMFLAVERAKPAKVFLQSDSKCLLRYGVLHAQSQPSSDKAYDSMQRKRKWETIIALLSTAFG